MKKVNTLDDIVDFMKRTLNLDDRAVNDISNKISYEFGGEFMYISRTHKKINRDNEIRRRFNGRNINNLSSDYNLTTRQIYNIIKKKV